MPARDASIEPLEAGGGGGGGRPQREEGMGQLNRPHPCAVGRGRVSLLANSDAWDSKHFMDVGYLHLRRRRSAGRRWAGAVQSG